MSIALQAQVDRLEQRVAELESRLEGFSRFEMLSLMAAIELRLEKIEGAKTPQTAKKVPANG
ncbi:hypothetical protein [Pararobbsia silviterrae]|uniref:Uncharacterized protein n=1 Tax=Pararobbsia silviterrae TaxID=1792498 RepID=A0A494Y6Y6_9BURK|nr:hypothetical protein [Pararobbsia silviterrae]RKP56371.1 hypothetical protein D7S86_08200 [Pararobbsia silviterrae]